MNLFHDIITEIGKELKINVSFLSDDWVTFLEKDNKFHYIVGYRFDLNNSGIASMMDDKGLFYDLLKYHHIPIVEHQVLLRNYDKQEVLDYFHHQQNEIVIKGCIGNSGNEVFKINKEEDLFKTIDKLFIKQYSVALQPYYDIINEYRVIVLNNEVQLVFGKIKPFVIGDGKKTVLELAQTLSKVYQDHPEKIEKPNYIPKFNERFDLSFKFNLSSGGKSFLDIDEGLKKEIIDLALSVTKKTNIAFASVDVVYTREKKLMIMEANAGVFMNNFIRQNKDGYNIAYNIYKKAIKMMFDIK